ncbi:MAG: glycoside hydrolase family 2 protein, partial [Spirochaetaceae bacterium]|nr:glycoside hydrolase family 2 protein [Spirochaetaceae bacterium]
MILQKLHENWQMRNVSEKTFFPAIVPGSVYNDLLSNTQMEDPFWRDNEDAARNIMEHDFEYVLSFNADEDVLACEKMLLRCNGLDTLAEIYLNEKLIAATNNMHRTYEFDVSHRITKEENTLRIIFRSPIAFMQKADAAYKLDGSSDCTKGFPHLRKAHCMSGWDWGPRLPDAGIWRDIELVGITEARLDSVYVIQKHTENAVDLHFAVKIDSVDSVDSHFDWEVTITAPDGNIQTYTNSPEHIAVHNPLLWWPNGYGKQYLYTIKVVLFSNGNEIDSWQRRIGLRTMTVNTQKDEWGNAFAQEVNGIQMFAMGADYIPE